MFLKVLKLFRLALPLVLGSLFYGDALASSKFLTLPFKEHPRLMQGWDYNFSNLNHQGIDYFAPTDTDIVADANGLTTKHYQGIPKKRSYGNFVIIDHENNYKTLYAHLSQVDSKITRNTPVKRGEVIGKSGMTGTDNPHLHFESLTSWDNGKGSNKGYGWRYDPYDIYNVAAYYPPGGTKFTQCGVENIWKNGCPPGIFILLPSATLSVGETTDTTTKLSWTKPEINNFQKYSLYRSEVAGGTSIEGSRTLVSEFTNPDTLEHTDIGLTPLKDYFYKLYAYDTSGNFSESEEVSVKTTEKVFITKNITQNSYSQNNPRITDKYVVWEDGRYVAGRITSLLYIYDIKEDKIKIFPAGFATGAQHVSLPSIYGEKVVFEGRRSWAENVYVYDMEAYLGMGGGFMVEGTAYNYVVYPEIYKNIVVWVGYGSGTRQDIYYFDLDNVDQGKVALAVDASIQQSPSIWERKIVYTDTTSTNTKVVLVDIDTKEKTVLFEGRSTSNPEIDQGIVSWVSNRNLYYYDINSKQTRSIGGNMITHARTKEKKIIYYKWKDVQYSTGGSIRIFDTVTGEDKEIVSVGVSSNFDYANGFLAYTDHSEFESSSTNRDIFLMKVE